MSVGKKRLNKKGLSPIIAAVLLLLVTIAAIAIIAGVIVPFTREGLEESSSCLDFQTYFQFEENFEFGGEINKYNCYDETNNLQGLSIAARSERMINDSGIIGFNLILTNADDTTKAVSVREGAASCVDGGVRLFGDPSCSDDLSVPKIGEIVNYVYNLELDDVDIEELEVYPVLKGDKACEVSDFINNIDCRNLDLSWEEP